MIVPAAYFEWFASALVGISAAAWVVVDLVRLRRALAAAPTDHDRGDRIFGSLVGLAVGIVGVTGVLWFLLG